MYIVADIGGTKMRVAGSHDLEKFGEPIILDTPRSYADGLAVIVKAAKKSAANEPIESIMVGITGFVSEDHRIPLTAPHLPDWRDKSLAADLEHEFDGRAHLENDVGLVGLGEAAFGAGKGASIIAYITVSTGVNGARIVEGSIDHGHAEIGGQYIPGGDPSAGGPKSLEELVSGTAISEKYGVHPKEIEKDSPVWEELATYLAYGVHNTIVHWSPDRVVLGGSMFNEIGIKVDRVHAHVQDIMKKFPTLPEITHSTLTDVGGLWGGLARLRQISPK